MESVNYSKTHNYSKVNNYLYTGEVGKPRQRGRMWDCYSLKCKLIFGLYYKFTLCNVARLGGKSAEMKKSAEIRRNTQKHPSKNPKQYAEIRRNTQAKTPSKNTPIKNSQQKHPKQKHLRLCWHLKIWVYVAVKISRNAVMYPMAYARPRCPQAVSSTTCGT